MFGNSREFGKFLRNKRIKNKISQTQVAKSLGYTAQYISNWERGASAPPVKKLYSVMRVYKIDPEEFIEFVLTQEELALRVQLKAKIKSR